MRSKIGILKYAAAVILSGMVCSCTKGLDGNQPDLVNPGGSQEATFYVYEAPDNYEGVPKSPIYKVTVIQNGVVLQNHTQIQGTTEWIGFPQVKKHGDGPIILQSHGDPSEPVSFRNIWIREL